ncbi:hypothetical protein F4801DRAFT_446574 [Xylaria longipes]|nr:hypothetical protein F4801DRAFT_446574 [Xylaria longipes]
MRIILSRKHRIGSRFFPTGQSRASPASLGDREAIKAKVKPKPDAYEFFREQLSRGQETGALWEESPGVIHTMLGRLPSKSRVKIQISFITLLRQRIVNSQQVAVFTIPAFIASRCRLQTSIPRKLTIEAKIVTDRIGTQCD